MTRIEVATARDRVRISLTALGLPMEISMQGVGQRSRVVVESRLIVIRSRWAGFIAFPPTKPVWAVSRSTWGVPAELPPRLSLLTRK